MNRWDEYQAAARQLDTVRREAAGAVAAQQTAATAAQEELTGVRQRIALQRSRFTDVAGQLTRTPLVLEPLVGERVAAASLVEATTADPTPSINAALKGARATLDAADATLSVATNPPVRSGRLPQWPPAARHALAYAGYALLALCALGAISAFAGGSPQARVVVTGLAIVFPAGAWMLGWRTIGLLGVPDSRGHQPRSPLLGAAICLVSMFAGLVIALL